jgi:RNA polymerase sigma-70 factor (ECF subfamily)
MKTHPPLSTITRRATPSLSAGRVRRLPVFAGVDLVDADDATLARALLAHDPEARSVVCRRFKPAVTRMAARFFHSPADIEDAVQDVFVCFFSRIHTLSHPEALRSFIISITRFTIAYRKKRAVQRRFEPLDDRHADRFTVTLDPDAHQTLSRVFQLLGRVGTLGRSAFVLRFIHGLEIVEVADVLGRSPATIKRHLAHTRRRVLAMVPREAENAARAA